MSYKVLYRKYRPDNFETLVDQDYVVKILKNSIINNKISHAYIFSGPRGTGKTSTARILAKTINCTNNHNGEPCETCINCQNFNESPDIIEIDAASNNGVDEIRELINNVKLMPSSSKYKVYIIDEVHMLSQSAFNALLLTLEEPPKHVIFILATTNIESVPITILSRCQKFEFTKISDDAMLSRLKKVCIDENIEYEEDGLREIVSLSDGGLRDALSILDQLSKENVSITLDLVTKEIGSISNKKISDLLQAIDSNDILKINSILEEISNVNLNYKIFVKKFIEILTQKSIEILNGNCYSRLSYSDIKNMVFEFNDCLNKININVNPYLLLEMIILSYVNGVDIKIDNNIKKINTETTKENCNIEKEKVNEKEKPINKNKSLNYAIDIRINNCFVSASKDMLNFEKNNWENFINNIKNPKLKGLVLDTYPVAASDKYIILMCSIEHNIDDLNYEINDIEKEFNSYSNVNKKLVFISEKTWEKEKNTYVLNLKKGIKYEFKLEDQNIDDTKKDDKENIEDIANNIFDLNKIEIQ